jgi:hypothetical protein
MMHKSREHYKPKFKNSITISHIYTAYKKKFVELGINRKTFVAICRKFNKEVSSKILLESRSFELPRKLGSLRICKKQVDLTKDIRNKYRAVDWKRSKALQMRVCHLNDHTNGYHYGWKWLNRDKSLTYYSLYSFIPTRTNKRNLAEVLKSPDIIIDYLER